MHSDYIFFKKHAARPFQQCCNFGGRHTHHFGPLASPQNNLSHQKFLNPPLGVNTVPPISEKCQIFPPQNMAAIGLKMPDIHGNIPSEPTITQ